ncbi:MAG: CYTH domain-containing protein [Gammaproteobacteria bacterium]|nr:CYTH domain-containing protein [Gammaproteobacteria bacterium]
MLEQELKLTAPRLEVLNDVFESPYVRQYSIGNPLPPARFLGIYYDTQDDSLRKAKCSFRARLEGSVFRAAFKSAGETIDGLFRHQEYETVIDGWLENVSLVPEGELKDVLLQLLGPNEPLVPRVKVDMQRRVMNLKIEETQIELVADQGVIAANDREHALFELELELKQGDIERIMAMGEYLKSNFSLVPSRLTKHQIGLGLWQIR